MRGQEQLRGGLGPGDGAEVEDSSTPSVQGCVQVWEQAQHSKKSLEKMLSSAAVRRRGGKTKKPRAMKQTLFPRREWGQESPLGHPPQGCPALSSLLRSSSMGRSPICRLGHGGCSSQLPRARGNPQGTQFRAKCQRRAPGMLQGRQVHIQS